VEAMTMAKSSTSFEAKNKAALRHAQRSLLARSKGVDTSALSDDEMARLIALGRDLATREGIILAMRELTGNMRGVVEWGMSWAQREVEQHGPEATFDSPPMKSLATYANSTGNLLMKLFVMTGEHGSGNDAASILDSLRKADGDGDGQSDK